MYFTDESIKIHYKKEGLNGPAIILLHGWGQSLETFDFLIKHLKENYQVFALDLPGFGKSDQPTKSLSIDDYVKTLKNFISHEKITDFILLGHSLGGRIAIKYSANNRVRKLVLINSAGIRPKRSLDYYFRVYRYKLMKKLGRTNPNAGSADYRSATSVMKGTLSLVVKEDLKQYADIIKAETLIIWGSDDQVTPLKDAYTFLNLIDNSDLAIIPGTGHFCYLENKAYFLMIVNSFLLRGEERD